jgi:2-polyprenyl-3-methyl-5-hydroxy-6-metoxy-1,4-benzoquinol methylase
MSEASIEYLSPVVETEFPENWYELADATHFWMQWRLDVTLRLLDRLGVPRDRELRALDIGCGAGLFRQQIESATRWFVDATDLNLPALRMAAVSRGRTLYYDVTREDPALVGTYDVCFLFDVIEHVPDERALLSSALRHLRPGGHLLVNVPAVQSLFSAYDVAAGHLRRYSRRTLRAAFTGLADDVRAVQYWGLSLVPLVAARRVMVGKTPTADTIRVGFQPPSQAINSALKTLSKVELGLLPRPPLGTSVLAAVRRPER